MSRTPVSVVIANNQFLVREGLKAIMQEIPGVEVIAECSDSESIIQAVEHGTGVLIIDPLAIDGFEPADLPLMAGFAGWKFLVITACDNLSLVKTVVESGVSGYLTRTCDRAEIEEAVLRVADGETTYCHKVLDMLMGRQVVPGVNCDPTVLSDREVEIIRLIASGLTTKEIASTLYRSSHTISTHRKNIMRKLNLKTSSELMVFAMNAGLVVNES